ncbi:1-phosphofructokinase [Lihuaxuella thermophila]|uniref:Tagatose-6-phosphate kinase n=1 Tax=Lihuaxuella thermophila TaxID=1173111 RepID=A0A1H8CLX3_9BACL|nr:1-phosphofructokinase [Lihuaxuella thermophila]SEM96133.1 tagatose 6-phosphate kinase [Lihuaxuella thermophila]
MITTVTLNPAIDKTYRIRELKCGRIHRVQQVTEAPGGKGINVAKVLHRLGQQVVATGLIGGYNGQRICHLLDEMHINHDFCRVSGESRLCLNMIDDQGVGTEVLEPGPAISPAEWKRMKDKCADLAKQSSFVVFSGSLPLGLDQSAYQQLVHLVQQSGAKAVLDTSGAAFRAALDACPFMVKPNLDEVRQILGANMLTREEIGQVIQEWHQHGVEWIAVSLGAEGAIVSRRDAGAWLAIPPQIEAVNPVGSGDSFVAGFVAGLAEHRSLEECIQWAVACGAANALEERAGEIVPDRIREFNPQVKLVRLSIT